MNERRMSTILGKIIGAILVVAISIGIFFGSYYFFQKINNKKIKGVYYYDGTIYEESDDFKDKYGYTYLVNKNDKQGKLYENLYHSSIDFIHKKKDLEEYNDQSMTLFCLNKISKYKVDYDEALQTYEIFERDNPEFYWLTNIYFNEAKTLISFSIDKDYMKYTDRSTLDINIQLKLYQLDEDMSTKTSDYSKISYLYDYVRDNMEYSFDDSDSAWAHNIIGFFKKGLGVCESYSETFMLLCKRYGIDNIQLFSSEHAWNIAKVDGAWYVFDVTNDFFGETEDFYQEYGKTYEYNEYMYSVPTISSEKLI